VPEQESGQSQVFIAIDGSTLGAPGESEAIVDRIVAALHEGAAAAGETARYPGEHTLEVRRKSLAEGVPVNDDVWREVRAL
jgi:LDH2 family malate/lactate/ureidoglycolate dehydrogenase